MIEDTAEIEKEQFLSQDRHGRTGWVFDRASPAIVLRRSGQTGAHASGHLAKSVTRSCVRSIAPGYNRSRPPAQPTGTD